MPTRMPCGALSIAFAVLVALPLSAAGQTGLSCDFALVPLADGGVTQAPVVCCDLSAAPARCQPAAPAGLALELPGADGAPRVAPSRIVDLIPMRTPPSPQTPPNWNPNN